MLAKQQVKMIHICAKDNSRRVVTVSISTGNRDIHIVELKNSKEQCTDMQVLPPLKYAKQRRSYYEGSLKRNEKGLMLRFRTLPFPRLRGGATRYHR